MELNNSGQMKIMQMTFMIVAVFLFFVLVGLFFLAISLKDVRGNAAQLQKEQAISSLGVITDMMELNYDSADSMTFDEDKLIIMSGNFGEVYESFWPIASISVYKIHPAFSEMKKCPSPGCNYYEVSNNGQTNTETFSTYVSICKKIKGGGSVYDKCEIGKLVVGVKIYED